MDRLPPTLAFLLLLFSGWLDHRQQQDVIDYRRTRIGLPAAHGPRRVRLRACLSGDIEGIGADSDHSVRFGVVVDQHDDQSRPSTGTRDA